MGDTYKKSKGNAGLDGVQFQLNLLTVFLLNSIRSRKNWKISTENQEAGKYDDIVLELPNKSILLQAKFKQNKKINMDQLFSCNSKSSDFSLLKYFFSYLEVKSESVEKTFIVCTNARMDEKGLEPFLTRHFVTADSTLHYEETTCPFFTFNENAVPNLKASALIYLDRNLKGKNIDKAVVTDENIKDFLNHFQFFSNYPSGHKLEKIIEQLLSRLNNSSLYHKVSPQDMYKKVEDWFKQPKGEYLTEVRARGMFVEIKSDKYCEKLKNYKVSFKRDGFNLKNPKRIIHMVPEGQHILQALKIYYTLQKHAGGKLYINPDDTVEVQKQIIEAFGSPRHSFLIIIGIKITGQTAIEELSSKLKAVLEEHRFKKIILVAESNDRLSQQFELDDTLQVDGSVKFEDLSVDCQNRLLKQNNIIFQGEQTSLEQLLATRTNVDWARAIDSEILERLIRNKMIKVGEPLNLDEPTFRYYINRMFERHMCKNSISESQPHLNVYSSNKAEKRIFSEVDIYDVNEHVVLISDNAGTGKSIVLTKIAMAIREKHPHLWVMKVQLTKYTNILRNLLTNRVKSVNVMEFLSSKKTTNLSNQLERYLFSTDKTVVLMIDAIDEISPDYTELVLSLLTQCLQATNFAKLFVTTRPHMVRELEVVLKVQPFVLQPFTEQNQVDFLTSYWVHSLNLDTENKGKCERYAMALLDSMLAWTKGYSNKKDDFTAVPLLLSMLAEIFRESIKLNESSDWEGCKEYLKGTRLKPKLPEKFKIKELYDMFIEKKRDIYIYKGNPSGNSLANTALIAQFDESVSYHRRLALEAILFKEDCQLFSCYHQQCCEDRNDNALKIGIVQRPNDEPHFIHRTFAEYFVAESLLHELQFQLHCPNVKFQAFFIDKLLQFPEYIIIRTFLDNCLQKVVCSIPSQIFKKYQSHICHEHSWKNAHKLIHSLAGEGCVALLQLILKCVHFKIIRDKEINTEDLACHIFDNKRNVSQYLARKILINKKNNKENTLTFIQTMVQRGGINIRDRFGRTPLHYAASSGHFEMTRFLTAQGAKVDIVDQNGMTPLHFAAWNGHLDTVKLLHELGVDLNVKDIDGNTVGHLAASNGHLDTIKYLHELSADLNVGDNNGRTPLHFAAANGHLDAINFLLELGVNSSVGDSLDSTPLHFAAGRGQLAVVEFFAKLSGDITTKDIKGRTPLHLAAKNGHLDTVKLYNELGVGFNIEDDNGSTPLHFAVEEGQLAVVEYILESSRSVGLKERTVLQFGAANGPLDSTEIRIRERNDRTAPQLALSRDHLQIADYFLNRNNKKAQKLKVLLWIFLTISASLCFLATFFFFNAIHNN